MRETEKKERRRRWTMRGRVIQRKREYDKKGNLLITDAVVAVDDQWRRVVLQGKVVWFLLEAGEVVPKNIWTGAVYKMMKPYEKGKMWEGYDGPDTIAGGFSWKEVKAKMEAIVERREKLCGTWERKKNKKTRDKMVAHWNAQQKEAA